MEKIWHIKNKVSQGKMFSNLEKIFSQYITKDEKIAVAVSGGPDSMFLSYQLCIFFIQHKYNLNNIFFIHLNHQVRTESNDEAKYIQQWFKGFHSEIITRPKTSRHSENDLRKRRYATFLEVMIREKIDKIFLGHHFDDRIETSLLNLLRGCGVDGFMGIKIQESHHLLQGKKVIRPLLSIRKEQILQDCTSQDIPYVFDKSNQDTSVSQRNYIRNKLLPLLFSQDNFESLFQHRYQKYDNQSDENLLKPISMSPHRKAKSAYCLSKARKEIDTQDLLRIFKQLHASSGITRDTLKDFLLFVQNASKGRKYLQGVTVMIAHNQVYFFVAPERFREKTLDNHDKIDTLNQVKRYPKKDDSFRGKTWNKYCITEKIPVFRRNFIPVIAKGDKIISRDKKDRKETTII